MKREIKFRVINGIIIVAYEYLTDSGWKHLLLNNQTEYVGCFDDPIYGYRNKRAIRNQFTGLKDKHDKEIYEGDILKTSYGKIGEVVYHNERASFIIHDPNHFNEKLGDSINEIIGNIYDNPELLTVREEKK